MTRRLLVPLILLLLALSGCRWQVSPESPAGTSCSPPAGGRCAADVAWRGPLVLSTDELRLHGGVGCGGTLRADETADTVTITLHVAALGPGMRSCALVDVGVRLHAPLGGRTVVDGVTGHEVRVIRHPRFKYPVLGDPSTLRG